MLGLRGFCSCVLVRWAWTLMMWALSFKMLEAEQMGLEGASALTWQLEGLQPVLSSIYAAPALQGPAIRQDGQACSPCWSCSLHCFL